MILLTLGIPNVSVLNMNDRCVVGVQPGWRSYDRPMKLFRARAYRRRALLTILRDIRNFKPSLSDQSCKSL